jgi:hypothetical protein
MEFNDPDGPGTFTRLTPEENAEIDAAIAKRPNFEVSEWRDANGNPLTGPVVRQMIDGKMWFLVPTADGIKRYRETDGTATRVAQC